MGAAGRNIVLLSDGTGNSAGKLFKTNVWRTYDALDLSTASQIASYDDGVGTSSIKPLAIFGGAVGWGLKRNVLSLYAFLCRNYKPGDRIYGFGFSRGAFTMRVFINFVLSQGLIADATSSDDLRRKALRLYREFRVEKTAYYGLHTVARPLRDAVVWLRDVIRGQRRELRNIAVTRIDEIEFLGLWDTVDAYGLPIAELGKGVDQWIWPLSLGDKDLDPRVKKVCHALAIDDKRTTFHPLLWDESKVEARSHTDDERLTQVWFVGAHANVGGGYPDDALSYVPLRWMIGEARKRGMQFNQLAIDAVDVRVSPYGRIYNSRSGLGAYYRYDPRRLDPPRDRQGACIPFPKIHESVVWRMAMGTDAYAPLSLPNGVRVVTDARETTGEARPCAPKRPNILAFEEYRREVQTGGELYGAPAGKQADDEARKRAAADFEKLIMPDEGTLELLWDTVWWRRVSYFISLVATAAVLLFPWLVEGEVGDNPIVWSAGLMAGFLPGAAHPWVEAFQANTISFSLLLAATGLFFIWGALLDRRIHDRALAAWSATARANRFRDFRTNVRGRVATVLSLLVPGVAAILLIVVAVIMMNDVIGALFLGALGFLILLIELPIAIWWLILWRVRRRGETSQAEVRGPALWFANRLRTWPVTAGPYRFFARHILPSVFAFALIAAAVYGLSRISFAFMESAEVACAGGSDGTPLKTETQSVDVPLDTSCKESSLTVRANSKYRISVQPADDWSDDGVPVSADGNATYSIGWAKYLQLPLRRSLMNKWFVVIARVGPTASEEYALHRGENTITPKKSGRLNLFVNDAVIGWFGHDRFYRDNKGTARVQLQRIEED